MVYAKNVETGEEGYKEVVELFEKEATTLVYLQIDDELIITTENHPFWINGEGFKVAGEIRKDDEVVTAIGEVKKVTDITIKYLIKPVKVYNFEVADWHTYYVSESEVLVHNKCSVDSSKKNSNNGANTKKQTPDQKALRDLAKDAEKSAKNGQPISQDEAKILDEWADEYNVPQHHKAYPGSGAHFKGGNYADHTHIYNIHIPYK